MSDLAESEPETLTRADFARRQGWDPSYVTRLEKLGRIVLDESGSRVRVAESLAKIEAEADPSRDGARRYWAEYRRQRDVGAELRPDAKVTDEAERIDFHVARAKREHYLAALAEQEYHKQRGELVERQRVEMAAQQMGRLLRDELLGLPLHLAADFASLEDAAEIERRLTVALTRILGDLAKITLDDLEKAMQQ